MLAAIHTIFGFVALALGAAIFLRRKGTRPHRLLGATYIASMLILNQWMAWSYAGLLGATINEAFVHMPPLDALASTSGGRVILLTQGVFFTVAAVCINRLMMRTVARYQPHAVAVASHREPPPATGSSLPD